MEDTGKFSNAGYLFRLSETERATLTSMGKKKLFRKDEMVFTAGDASQSAYILLEGRVKVFQTSSYGKDVIFWFCFPGELFGIAEVVNSARREVHAQACRNLSVLEISYSDLRKFFAVHPNATMNLIDQLGSRIRVLSNSLLNLVSEDVNSRVMKMLYRLCKCYGQQHGDVMQLPVHLTHQELADMVGTSRQTVTSVLGVLRRDGVIDIKNHIITILDLERIKPKDGEANFIHFEQSAAMKGIAI